MLGKTVLGRYRLLRSLGSGSNGEVFLAEPIQHPQYRVVVKRIHDHVVTHAKFNQLFEAEVRSMANFDHPYAVGLIEASLDDPIGPCLVLEYVPGVTLEDYLALHKRLEPERAALLLGCMCHALQAAHTAGIVHRDLKPANLMVVNPGTPKESLKVMDFGFAGFAAKPHIQLAELTGHGPIYAMGTPGYVSPEMIRGDRVDGRSDLYSVGVILFEMLTGRLPFTHEFQDKLLAAHIKEPPPRFHKIGCGNIPAAVEGVVQLALSKYPNERQQSMREMAEGFGKALGVDLWSLTAPAGWEPPPPPAKDQSLEETRIPEPHDQFDVYFEVQVTLPERMAAAKLRGFVEDHNAEVLASDPGLIRMRVGLPGKPRKKSGLFGWFTGLAAPTVVRGQEPIEVELHMDKPHPSQPRLRLIVACHPLPQFLPRDRRQWRTRCEAFYNALRQYLGA